MILYIKRSIKFDLFSISGRFRKKSSDWNRKVTIFEFIQFALQKSIQNKLQKLFKTNVIITL